MQILLATGIYRMLSWIGEPLVPSLIFKLFCLNERRLRPLGISCLWRGWGLCSRWWNLPTFVHMSDRLHRWSPSTLNQIQVAVNMPRSFQYYNPAIISHDWIACIMLCHFFRLCSLLLNEKSWLDLIYLNIAFVKMCASVGEFSFDRNGWKQGHAFKLSEKGGKLPYFLMSLHFVSAFIRHVPSQVMKPDTGHHFYFL